MPPNHWCRQRVSLLFRGLVRQTNMRPVVGNGFYLVPSCPVRTRSSLCSCSFLFIFQQSAIHSNIMQTGKTLIQCSDFWENKFNLFQTECVHLADLQAVIQSVFIDLKYCVWGYFCFYEIRKQASHAFLTRACVS